MIQTCKVLVVKYVKLVMGYAHLVNICMIFSLLPRILMHNIRRIKVSDTPHVLLVMDGFRTGGMERVLIDTYHILVGRGHRVSFLFHEEPSSRIMLIPDGVRVKTIGWHGFRKQIYVFTKHILLEKPDIVYVGNPLMIAIASVSKILLFGRMRLIARIDSDYTAYITTPTRADPGSPILKQIRLLSWLLWVPNQVIIIEKSMENGIRDLSRFPVRLTCLRNPVDLERIERMSWEGINHPWLSGDFEVILSVSRLVPIKNQAMLLRAFAMLAGHRAHARLIIIGDGQLRKELEAFAKKLGIADLVHFTGNIPNPYAWMRRSDVLVVSSYAEGGPLVAIEAMACNLPVVSTNVLSASDVLEDGKFGEIVDIDDDAAMVDAILRTMDHPHREGLVDASGRYSIAKHADGLCRILKEIL